MPRFTASALLALMALALMISQTAALNTKIEARTEVCFKEHVGRDIPLSFQFKVTAGGKLDIDVSVYDASGHRLNHWNGATEGHFNVRGDSQNNHFRFCFNNEVARFTPKWVNFYLHQGPPPSAAKAKDLDPIEVQIKKARDALDTFQQEQYKLRSAEHDHRNTVEDINERMLLWSVFEGLALFGMGIFQIFFLKRFLEVKTSV